jgi:hypothetical protein
MAMLREFPGNVKENTGEEIEPNGWAPAWKATTVQRVWAGVTARLAEPRSYPSLPVLSMGKIDHLHPQNDIS